MGCPCWQPVNISCLYEISFVSQRISRCFTQARLASASWPSSPRLPVFRSRRHAHGRGGGHRFRSGIARCHRLGIALWRGSSIRRALQDGSYKFNRLRLAPVPKASGGYRIIAIPTVRDRLLQRVLLRGLEADSDLTRVRPLLTGLPRGARWQMHNAPHLLSEKIGSGYFRRTSLSFSIK